MTQPSTAGVDPHDLPLTARGRIDGRSARKVATRRRIISAASELFATNGYTGTSMDLIAETAGVSKGTIFYNFTNKSDLFEQLVRHSAQSIADAMTTARAGLRGAEAMSAAMWGVMKAVDADPAAAQILTTELFRVQRPWAERLGESRRILLAPLVEILDEVGAERQGLGGERLLPREFQESVAMTVLGALVVATMDHHAYDPNRPLKQAHTVIMQLIRGLLV